MKKMIMCLTVCSIVIGLLSCGPEQIKDVDLTAKGIIKARIVSREGSGTSQYISCALYFRRLDDSNDLTKGKIISSSIYDGDKIVINYEPGTYVIIASMRRTDDISKYLICYDEELINKTKVELKAGDTIDLGDIYVEESSANLLGNISEVQTKTRDTIGSDLAVTQTLYKLGVLDKGRYPKAKKEKEEKKEVIEKFE